MNPHNRSTVLFKQYSYFYTEISFQAADAVIFQKSLPILSFDFADLVAEGSGLLVF